jgi:hypothetical protein
LFLLADFCREESGGKFSVLGLYAGGAMLVPKDRPTPHVMPLALIFLVTSGAGTFKPTVEVKDPAGKSMLQVPLVEQAKPGDAAATIILQFANLVLPELGQYTVILTLNGVEFRRSFVVREPTS